MNNEELKSPAPAAARASGDMSLNEAILREQIKKRSSIKGRLTLFSKYVSSFEGAQLTSKQISEIKLRIDSAKSLLKEFNSIQTLIEELTSESDIGQQLDIREAFENSYYGSMAAISTLLVTNSNPDSAGDNTKCNSQSLVKLPTISLPSFNGSYGDWLEFRDTFYSMIHNSTQLDNMQKFHYLRSSLTGIAAQVIKAVEFTSDNYSIAWDLLTNRFNNTKLLVHNHVKSLFSIQSLNKESSASIRKLVDTVLKNLRALNTLGEPTAQWDTLIIYIIVSKLDSQVEKEWEQYKNHFLRESSKPIKLEQLLNFLNDKADTLDIIKVNQTSTSQNSSKLIREPNKGQSQPKSHSFVSTDSNMVSKENSWRVCPLCAKNHLLYTCARFLKLPVGERYKLACNKNLCTNCLRAKHEVSECHFGSCKQCNKKHNSLLHGYFSGENALLSVTAPEFLSAQNNTSTVLHTSDEFKEDIEYSQNTLNDIILATALVEVAGVGDVYHTARALLDSGSQHCIMTNAMSRKINAKSIQSTFRISGIGHSVTHTSESCEVKLRSRNQNYNIRIKCLVLNSITSSLPSMHLNYKTLNIPQDISLADPLFHSPSEIDLLLGADIFWDLLLDGRIRLRRGPYLQNTALGWIISGVMGDSNAYQTKLQCNFVQTMELNDQLRKFWEIEEVDATAQVGTSEDLACEKLFEETTKRETDGRFSVRIPLKESAQVLGNSFDIARSRFLSLERRLKQSLEYKRLYSSFMQEYANMGHMTKIESYGDPYVFLPHHGVLRQQSTTTKLRVVFDASQKTSTGISLNDIQMIGPPLQNDLFSILLRFRQYKFVVCADIEKMFRQVMVQEDQRDLQLILWREKDSDPLEIYRLNVVTYGMSAAPYLCIRCLRQLGTECVDKDIARIVLEDFYVDDLITGSDSASKLIDTCKRVSDVCISGCFPLRKWVSNLPQLTEGVKESSSNSKSLSLDENYSCKTLGLGWLNKSDEFHFVLELSQEVPIITKRSILSIVSQIYDPLSLLSPVVIIGKMLLQRLWLCKVSWDDIVPNNIITAWKSFLKSLSYLHEVRVPRHVLGYENSKVELHIFCDASETAYGACAYIRTCTKGGDPTVKLLCSKGKVAPIKPVSLPRLELCGALLGTRLLVKISKSLRLRFDEVIIWTDSTIVLSWLRTPPHQLKTFVRNRVAEISDTASHAIWLHVKSKQNPADLISRGVRLNELNASSLWWSGPPFLLDRVDNWCQPTGSYLKVEDMPELKQSIVCTARDDTDDCIIDFTRFSKLKRLQRTCAFVVRFIHNTRIKDNSSRLRGPLSVEELEKSLLILTQFAQKQSFQNEYRSLSKGFKIKSDRNLVSLNPFIDENNLIRVGGRLLNSNTFPYNKKHPKLLCGKHRLTLLLFQHEHDRLLHAGPQSLLFHIRENYWPLGGRNLARKVVRQCVKCCRMKGKVVSPLMGNLPSERLEGGFPFLNCGVDYAGPLFILNRRGRGAKLEKCYLCLFVCFATRALHLELVTSLSAEGYMLALKRFISRRGKPRKIFSDNGRNFVGASREMSEFFHDNNRSIIEFASDNYIEFKFIPPAAPHFGGLWEAGVKSCKHHITRVVGNAHLTYEEFYTVLVQIEAILNSRPMYPMSADPNDLSPLTPAHFLIGRPLTSYVEDDRSGTGSLLIRYKRVEQLRQSFWRRWSTEYISELQQRVKWQAEKEVVPVGTLVLIKDDNTPPLKWSLGRIVSLSTGKDGISRVATIRTSKGIMQRAFSKLCPLPVSDNNVAGIHDQS